MLKQFRFAKGCKEMQREIWYTLLNIHQCYPVEYYSRISNQEIDIGKMHMPNSDSLTLMYTFVYIYICVSAHVHACVQFYAVLPCVQIRVTAIKIQNCVITTWPQIILCLHIAIFISSFPYCSILATAKLFSISLIMLFHECYIIRIIQFVSL